MQPKSTTTPYDLLIIGGGPIGLACGMEAEKAGLSYLILEKGALCNSIYNYPLNMTFFSTADRLELGGIPFISTGAKPTRTEALDYYRRVYSYFQLQVKLYETVKSVQKEGNTFLVLSDKSSYTSHNLVLATGFYDLPNLLNVPGETLPKVLHYYKEPWPFVGQKLLVIGGANSAADAALECWRKGAEVSMVLLGTDIDQNVKYWVRPDIVNRIAEGSIRAFTQARVKEITKGAGVPVVYDSVGKETFFAALDCLAPLGMMVTYGNASGPPPLMSPMELAKRGSLFLTRPSLFAYIAKREDLDASAKELFRAVSTRKVKLHVGQRYPLSEAAQAHRDLEARKTVGSTVLIP